MYISGSFPAAESAPAMPYLKKCAREASCGESATSEAHCLRRRQRDLSSGWKRRTHTVDAKVVSPDLAIGPPHELCEAPPSAPRPTLTTRIPLTSFERTIPIDAKRVDDTSSLPVAPLWSPPQLRQSIDSADPLASLPHLPQSLDEVRTRKRRRVEVPNDVVNVCEPVTSSGRVSRGREIERTNALTLSSPPREAMSAERFLTISLHAISARASDAATGVAGRI